MFFSKKKKEDEEEETSEETAKEPEIKPDEAGPSVDPSKALDPSTIIKLSVCI